MLQRADGAGGARAGAGPIVKPGVVAARVYSGGRWITDTTVERAGEWAQKPGHVVWIGLYEPTAELLRTIQQEFQLHDLAIEDASRGHQRPKIEQYGDTLFIVARTAQMVDGRIAFGETHVFLGHGYLISVRHGPSTSYAAVRDRAEACPGAFARGENYILYAILDFIVDNYMPVIEMIEDEVDALEERVVNSLLTGNEVERLYQLRRDLLRLRNAVVPLVDVCRRLEHSEVMPIEAALQPLFRDVTDHVRRVQEAIDAQREVLAFTYEASVMAGQAEQTAVSRRLAAWAAILAVPTAVAGIYGMNFKFMPELEWEYGYHATILVIVTACATLYWRFKRNGWL
ncbi:magnesium/cobalt transporter CorA [Alsobacter sp. SYSU M60028]|uniref:Magnesium transport protein CorA n=1 Tax=Alsobacter ponti TaxID=2962936 RepID=A0ABT1LFE7_9HYPH|nr:magnesium/cobalt transporter CorA [Alsobacter ponti]MCP8940222.1 magnesium/cobalt transporter CorA [Alsobacter ponti]